MPNVVKSSPVWRSSGASGRILPLPLQSLDVKLSRKYESLGSYLKQRLGRGSCSPILALVYMLGQRLTRRRWRSTGTSGIKTRSLMASTILASLSPTGPPSEAVNNSTRLRSSHSRSRHPTSSGRSDTFLSIQSKLRIGVPLTLANSRPSQPRHGGLLAEVDRLVLTRLDGVSVAKHPMSIFPSNTNQWQSSPSSCHTLS